MKLFFKLKTVVFLLPALFVLASCGYKPSAKFARNTLGEKISTSVVISSEDPQNTVVIKDAVDKAVIKVFQASLVDKSVSDTHLVLKISAPSYSPIVYDENGYVTAYRMSIVLNIVKYADKVSKVYTTKGYHDFSVVPNAIVTDQDRLEAIDFAAQRAIRSFLARVSAEGARSK